MIQSLLPSPILFYKRHTEQRREKKKQGRRKDMAPQLAAPSVSIRTSSLLRLPLSPPFFSSTFRNGDLITRVCTTICRKRSRVLGLTANSTGKTSNQLTTVTQLPGVLSPLFSDNQDRFSLRAPASRICKSKICGQAFIYHSSGFRIPANAEKPEWWWRTLSCIPYLIALQMSATGFYIEPLLDKFSFLKSLVFYIPGAVNRLPIWFPILYCYLAIVGVVKNRNLPLIFRFHVMTGMLLEIALQIVWVASNFFPLIHFKGSLGMYYWAGVALAYIFVMAECIRSALLGTFVKIPVISESAFIHSLFGLGGSQRPS